MLLYTEESLHLYSIMYFIVVPQNLLTVEAEPFYDSSSRLSEVRVHWRNQVYT